MSFRFLFRHKKDMSETGSAVPFPFSMYNLKLYIIMKNQKEQGFLEVIGFDGSTKQMLREIGIGAILGLGLLVACSVGEYINSLY